MRPLLIYIHGFKSSPLSLKAQEVKNYLSQQALPIDFMAPALPDYPAASYQLLEQLLARQLPRPVALVGSSMGGFMATVLAQQFDLRAVLVNPAVRPYELIGDMLGDDVNPYSGEAFTLHRGHLEELRRLEPAVITDPERLLVLLQTGDETLDYRKAVSFYHGCQQIVEQGGDHRFQNFEKYLPVVLKFLKLT